MDGTRLNTAADTIEQLAGEVDGFTNTASEKAAEVATKMRSTAEELRTMATALDQEGGTGEIPTPTA